jgi:hypothetical protein
MIRPPDFPFRPALAAPATLIMGVIAMAVALVSLGCASKEQAVVVPPLREASSTEVSAAAPDLKESPEAKVPEAPIPSEPTVPPSGTLEAKVPDAPIPSEPTVPPSGKEDGGGPAKQETAPADAPVQDRREATPPEVKTPKKAPAAPAPPVTPRGKTTVAPSPGKQASAPPLDLKSLEKRLRDTKAIGVFTKLSLKNQVDDLLSQFRTFHDGKSGAKLTTLRESYDLLIMKVLSLLQDSDTSLARDIAASRESLWSLLADPVKFATLT